MKIYTQQDFDSLPVVDGIKKCPAGDYSAIKIFKEACRFGEGCSFGALCNFGVLCRFGAWCSFGEACRFGKGCHFGEECSFGERCSFGEVCSFGKGCSFGEVCSFGKGCNVVGRELLDNHVRSVGGCGQYKRTLYGWSTKDGWFFQTGCYFDTYENFRTAVLKKYGEDAYYLKAAELLMMPQPLVTDGGQK